MRAVGLTLALLVGACGVARFRDVPDDHVRPGERYVSTAELIVHAITVEPRNKKVVDHYTVTPKPGFAGPEVLFAKGLPLGTVVKVISVQECTNCPFGRDRILIELTEFTDRPVSIATEHLNHVFSPVRQ